MEIEEKKDFRPVCPHCEGSISKLIKVKHGRLVQHIIYCCPHCRKIIGVGVREG